MNQPKQVPFLPADILIPGEGVSMERWSVVACDQYTSQPDYWQQVEQLALGVPSTLHITFPEAYLDQGDEQKRIADINRTMEQYINDGVFATHSSCYVFVERTVSNGSVRSGLVGVVDLEAYDYHKGASSLVRATEGTVLDRIPPRVKIREHAPLELPHVMLLIDDPQDTVIGPLKKQKLKPLYDFDLMQGGGHIKGYLVPEQQAITDALHALCKQQQTDCPLLFAVGDGNHSLATAKECWENLKKTLTPQQAATHPARYALTELVNIHDPSLVFEPIHRVLFDCDPADVVSSLLEYYPSAVLGEGEGQQIHFVSEGGTGVVSVAKPSSELTVGTLQLFLDDYVAKKGGRLDYIHGEEVTCELARHKNNIGFVLPAMEKEQLFPAVMADGALPRKTFSMGEAEDKRFYLECRAIR